MLRMRFPKQLRSIWVVLSTSFKVSPRRALLVYGLNIATAISTTLFGLWLKLIIDGVLSNDAGMALWGAGAMAVSLGMFLLLAWTGFNQRVGLEERTALYIDQSLMKLMGEIPGVEHYERPEYLDQVSILREQRQYLSSAVGALVEGVGMAVRILGTAGLLLMLNPLLLLLPVFSIPSLILGGRAERIMQTAIQRSAEGRRARDHLFALATTPGPAKEVRIFGLADELVHRQDEWMINLGEVFHRARTKAAILNASGWMIFALGYLGAIALVVTRAVNGQATAGDVILAITLSAEVNDHVSGATRMVGWLFATLKAVERYIWLIDYSQGASAKSDERVPVPDRINSEIAFDKVAFRYPGTERYILSDLSLRIPACSTVAIVGDNGAGKTTIVKLLSGFYEPTEGTIKLDQIDLREFDTVEWRSRLSAGFQDFARLELIARYNVGVGDLFRRDDPEAVNQALVRASADDVLKVLPNGLETQLGKSFENGVDLSGGQWQKLALGRAMMRDNPLVLILDEPTASLDAETEYALFEKYAGAARRVSRKTGAITIFVSHRFSTVQMADVIVVIQDGRAVEYGSHRELLANKGLYAELYELQARAYR